MGCDNVAARDMLIGGALTFANSSTRELCVGHRPVAQGGCGGQDMFDADGEFRPNPPIGCTIGRGVSLGS